MKKTKYRNILKESGKEINFKLTDLLLWKIINLIFAGVISLSCIAVTPKMRMDFVCFN